MSIRWSLEAQYDVERLVDFIAAHDPAKADDIEVGPSKAPRKLLQFQRLGSRLSEFDPREVRELRYQKYVFRYELLDEQIRVLRVFHAREDRS